jgi:F420H(2)-dependent biliverdin reductase
MTYDERAAGRARRSRPRYRADVALDPADLPDPVTAFLTERHLATLTTPRPDGGPHVVPVGFTWDPQARLVRVISSRGSVKVRNVLAAAAEGGGGGAGGARVAVCQVDGRRWLTLEGRARVSTEADDVREAERRYGERYRQPRPNPERIVILVEVDRVLGSVTAPSP